jgi:uncharacterized protein
MVTGDKLSMWIRNLIAGMLLFAPVIAVAAGFDCKQAANSVDHAICDDPALSALDSSMTDAYIRARHRAAGDDEKLMRDQRNWLAARNEMVSHHYDHENIQRNQAKAIQRVYQARIDFLNHLFVAPSKDSPLLTAIAVKLSASTEGDGSGDYASTSMWTGLGGDRSVFEVPAEQRYSAAEVAAHIPVDAGPALSEVIQAVSSGSDTDDVTLALLPSAKFGGIYSVGGTLYCVDWSLFAWEGRTIQPVETPKILQQNCWTTYGELATFKGQVYAVSDNVNLTSSEIQVQARVGDAWGAPNRLLVHYDYALGKPTGYCDSSNKDCDALTTQAYVYAGRYSRSRVVEALSVPMSDQERATFDAMRSAANDDRGMISLPTFGKTLIGYPDFVDGSVWFPVRWHGELMLGRIGHGGLGWRIDENWLVGIWRWDGKSLSPIAGVIVPTQRSAFLLSAVM